MLLCFHEKEEKIHTVTEHRTMLAAAATAISACVHNDGNDVDDDSRRNHFDMMINNKIYFYKRSYTHTHRLNFSFPFILSAAE
jgi:hypothetical protein